MDKGFPFSVGLVHVDYTAKGGPNRLRMILPDEADKLSKTPYAIIQVIVVIPVDVLSKSDP